MSIDAAEFRRVLGHFVTGVTIVTARQAGSDEPVGLTVNAMASLSLDPPLVLVCIERSADSHDSIHDAEAFAVNVLAAGQETLSRRFAELAPERKFDGVAWSTATTGAPVLGDTLAWVDCRIQARYPGGDHTIFVGQVVDADAREGAPLLYYRGGYADLAR